MADRPESIPPTKPPHASARPYVIGFILSILLTIEAYFLTISHSFTTGTIITIILILAIVQLLVQLFFFLHLDRMWRAPWNVLMFVFMAMVVSLVVFASLWIMRNLDYGHTKSGPAAAEYLKKDEGY